MTIRKLSQSVAAVLPDQPFALNTYLTKSKPLY